MFSGLSVCPSVCVFVCLSARLLKSSARLLMSFFVGWGVANRLSDDPFPYFAPIFTPTIHFQRDSNSNQYSSDGSTIMPRE